MFQSKLPLYLYDYEKVLWRAKPRTSPFAYARWTVSERVQTDILYRVAKVIGLVVGFITLLFLLFNPTVMLAFSRNATSFDNALIDWYMSLICVGGAFITVIVGILYQHFSLYDVWYVVSDHRVIWWSNKVCGYMFLKNLKGSGQKLTDRA
jgi:hypothetical protein